MTDAGPQPVTMFRGIGGDGEGSPVQRRATGEDDPGGGGGSPTPFVPVCESRHEPQTGAATPTRADIARTQAAIESLRAAMSLHRELVAANYLDNIQRYLTATAGDGALAMSKTDFEGLATKGVTKAFTTLPAKLPMDRFISRLVPAISTGAKLVGGVVLGFLYDALVELIFDPTGKKLRAAFRAGHAAGVAQMAEQAGAAAKMRLSQESRDSMLLTELRDAALFAQSGAALAGLESWIGAQIPALLMPVHDLSLYNHMLETWVLQRAGDEEDANKHTDPDAYAKAHEILAPDGNLARRDLFIHQCRFEFGRLGVDAEPTLASWRAKLEGQPPDLDLEEVVSRLGPLYLQTDRFPHPARLTGYLGERFAWDGDLDLMPSPEQVATVEEKISQSFYDASMAHAHGQPQHLERAKENGPRFERTVKTGGVRLACEVKVTEADGAIFVDQYAYRLWGTRHDAEGTPNQRSRPNDTKVPTKTWTDSPD